jgi:hypothetical protein
MVGLCRLIPFVLLVAVGPPFGGLADQAPSADATQVLAAARTALGGETAIGAIKTFVATGRARQIRGNNLVPIEFEITCELPDKFVRRDEFPAQDTDITVTGFVGDTLLQFPAPGVGRGVGPGAPPAVSRLSQVKQDFARLMLGAFAASYPTYPLTFTYAAIGEAPEGKADILDVAGPDQFSAQFVVQRETSLPVMLIWRPPAAPGRGGPPTASAPAPVEQRLYYGDFRSVGTVKWPFRIRRAVGPDTVEETTFDRVRFNVKVDPKEFEVPK